MAIPTPEEQRASKLVELRTQLDEIDAELLTLAEKEVLSEDEEARWQDLEAERAVLKPEHDKIEARTARAQEIKAKAYREIHGLPEVRKPVEELYGADVVRMDQRAVRDGALRILGDNDQNHPLSTHQGDRMERLVRSSPDIARLVVATENDHYRSAFHKRMLNADAELSPEESLAVRRMQELRAQSTTSAAGGYALPVFIDPSVILTDQETDNPFLAICRQVTVTTDAWKGVSSAGVSWSFDAEGGTVSDDSLTSIAQPTVEVEMARGFIPFTIEVGEDWPGFQAEFARLLAEGYDELLVSEFTNGSGTNAPDGLITALDATAASEVETTTAAEFGFEDIYKVWKELPQKYRRRASWMMSVDINNRIRQFGAANVYHAATVALPAGAAEVLFGRPVYENPYFPDFVATTAAGNLLVVGDFSNYVIARRTGMSVELVPHLFDVTANRPTGSRGWFAYARIGGNVVNAAGFRMLINNV